MRLTVAGHEVYAYTGSRALVATQPSLVFVHGAGNDHSAWALQSRYFAHHGYNVLALDLPGHGRSAGAALASVEAIAAWLPQLLDAAKVDRAALIGHSLGALACLACAANTPERVTKLALLGPAVPMPVSEVLLEAAQADDHVAFELINGWSHSAPRQLGGNRVPGLWMTGNAMRLIERTPPGVLYIDLLACNAYADGLDAARPCALSRASRPRRARPHGAGQERAGAQGGVARCARRHARRRRTRHDGRATRRGPRRSARVRLMASPRFFAAMPLQHGDVGRELALPEPVAHHALRVLRLAVGDSMTLFTGDGGEYAATLTRAGKRDAWARVDAFVPEERESTLAVTLVQALVKSDAMDAIVRHAVELGAAAVQPVVTTRSARFPEGAQGTGRLAHWRQIVVAACEQCGRNRVPVVREVVPLRVWLDARAAGTSGIVLDPEATRGLASLPPPAHAVDAPGRPGGRLRFGRGRARGARRTRAARAWGRVRCARTPHRSRRSLRSIFCGATFDESLHAGPRVCGARRLHDVAALAVDDRLSIHAARPRGRAGSARHHRGRRNVPRSRSTASQGR